MFHYFNAGISRTKDSKIQSKMRFERSRASRFFPSQGGGFPPRSVHAFAIIEGLTTVNEEGVDRRMIS